MEDNKRMPEGVERLDNDDLSQVSGGRLRGADLARPMLQVRC